MACAASGIRSAATCTRTIAVITIGSSGSGYSAGGRRSQPCSAVHRRSAPPTGSGAGRAHSAQPPAPRAGSVPRRVGRHQAGAVAGQPAVQQPRPPRRRAPRSGPAPGRTVCAPGAQRLDHRHRRHAAAGDPGRGQPAVAHHRQLPAAAPVRPGSDQLRRAAASAASRCARSSASDQPGQPVAAARRASSNRSPRRQRRHLVRERGSGAVVARRRPGRCSAAPPGAYSSTSGSPAHGARQRLQLVQRARARRRAAGRDAQRARAQRHGRRARCPRRSTAARRTRNGPSAPVARRAHHRQPRERLGRGRDPPRRVRVAGSAGCSGGRCAAISRSSRTAGLQRVRAHDRVHPLGQRDHVADPRCGARPR